MSPRLPAWVTPVLVLIVTWVACASALSMVLAATTESSAVGVTVQKPPEHAVLLGTSVVATLVATVMLCGSSSHWPPAPALTVPPAISRSPDEVSMKPPLPPRAPTAEMVPATVVERSDQTMTRPPLPDLVAFAVMVEPAAAMTVLALASGPLPW